MKYFKDGEEIEIVKQTEFSDGYAVGVSDKGVVYVIDEKKQLTSVKSFNPFIKELSLKLVDSNHSPKGVYLEKFDNGIGIAAFTVFNGWAYVSCFNKNGRELGQIYSPCTLPIKDKSDDVLSLEMLERFMLDRRDEINTLKYVNLARNLYDYALTTDPINCDYSKLLIDIKKQDMPPEYFIFGLTEVVEHIFQIDEKRHLDNNSSSKDIERMKECQQMVLSYYLKLQKISEAWNKKLVKRQSVKVRYVVREGSLRRLISINRAAPRVFDILNSPILKQDVERNIEIMGVNKFDTPRRQKRNSKILKYDEKKAKQVSKVYKMVTEKEKQDLQPENEL